MILRAWGPLRSALGGEPELELPPGSSVADALRAAAASRAESAPWLWRDGEPVPAVYRDGERLGADDPVRDGDRLDLVVAVSGGST